MAPSGAFLMLDPVAVAKQPPGGCSTTVAKASLGKEVSFWLEEYSMSKGILSLGVRYTNTHDPYGGDFIPSFLDVVCVEKGLALLCLRTPDRGVPTDYFVYSIADETLVAQLPGIHPEIFCSSSIGLFCRILDDGRYQYIVANFRLELNEETERMEAHLDQWAPECKDEKWIQDQVDLDFTTEENLTEEMKHDYMCEWETDQVVSLEKHLLWADLWRGILRSFDLLSRDKNQTLVLKYVPLPDDLCPKWPVEDAHHRREHPEPFRSVACCEGNLMLVNLYSSDGTSLKIETWKLGTRDWSWSKKETYEYKRLWESVKVKFPSESLPRWKAKANPPCFPVLSTHNSSILYLTLSAENRAFLVRISMKDKTVRITEYPPFCKHRNLLRPVDLSKGNIDPTAEWDQVNILTSPTRNSLFTRLNTRFKTLLPAIR